MGIYVMHVSLLRGEITPLMHGRVDSELYQTGLHTCRNGVASRYGGITRAPGLLHHGTLKVNTGTWLVPFIFNREQVYALEFSDLAVRFWTNAGQVMDGGTPYTVVSPYAAADLPNLQHWQSGDVVYITCPGYQTRLLTRSGETDWAFALYEPEDGPFLAVNTTDTTLKPADYGSATPTMTSNAAPSGTVGPMTSAWAVFSRSTAAMSHPARASYIDYTFAGGGSKVVDGYWIAASSKRPYRMPSEWKVQGYDGANYVTLDTRTGEDGWSASEKRFFEFKNNTSYTSYRFIWTGLTESTSDDTDIEEIGYHERAEDQTPFALTASSVDGINDGAGFVATDVGRPIRLFGSDGEWRWAKITGYTSPTEVLIQLYNHALPDLDPILLWRLGAWSDTTGWPKAIGSYENRVAFGNTSQEPFNVWLTKSAGYDNFEINEPLVDDDAVTVKPNPSGTGLDPVNWLLGTSFLVLGTEGNLKALGPRDSGKAFSPLNVRQLDANAVTTFDRPGFEIGNVIIFFDAYGQRMYEAAYSSEADGYVSREVSILNEHLLLSGVKRYAFQSNPNTVLWCAMNDGTLVAITYDRDQKVFGATRREIAGTVDDVLVLPGDMQDDLFVAVRRTVDGVVEGHMELLAPFYRSVSHDYPVYFDSSVVVTGSGLTGVTGADHLEGETVGVWVDGLDVGDAVVTAGAFTLPDAASGDTIVYGLRVPFYMRTLKLVQWGQRDGGGPGRQVRIADGYLSLFETAGISYGTIETQTAWRPEVPYADGAAPDLITGDVHIGTLDDQWRNGGVIVVTTDRGYPATVRGITVNAEGTP